MQNSELGKNYGGAAFIPLVVFLALFLGSGLFFMAMGVAKPFSHVPLLACLLVGMVVALAMNPKVHFETKLGTFAKSASESGVLLMVLIFMLAGAFASVSKGMGGVSSVVNLGLTFIPPEFLAPSVFLISCFISISTGTCVGTVVTMAPIGQGIALATGMDGALVMAAVLGGAMFGDNLSIISDTTIAATRGVGANMKDKFRMNFKIALPAALAALAAFALAGGSGSYVVEAGDYNLFKALPYIAVLVAAVAGVNVITVLIGGIVFSGLVGAFTGAMDFSGFMQAINNGMEGMAGVALLALFIRGVIGLIQQNGGIEWLVKHLTLRVKTRRGAEYSIGALSGALAFCMLDNTVAILTAAPIAKTIGDQFKIAPKRMASLLDIFACVALCIAPHTSMIVLLSVTAGVSPIDILSNAYYQMFLGLAAILTIQFGLMRTREEKEADREMRLEQAKA